MTEVAICNQALGNISARSITALDADSTIEDRQCNIWYAVTRDALLKKHHWGFATKYVALTLANPEVTIVGITLSGTDPVSIESTAHGYATGDTVEFTVTGVTDLNGNEYDITKVDANNFTLDDTDSSDFSGAYASGDIFNEVLTYSGWSYVYEYPSDCIEARKMDDGDTNTTIAYKIVIDKDLDEKYILSNKEDAVLIYTAKVTDVTMFDPLFVTTLGWELAAALVFPVKGPKPGLRNSLLAIARDEKATAGTKDSNEPIPEPMEPNTFKDSRS